MPRRIVAQHDGSTKERDLTLSRVAGSSPACRAKQKQNSITMDKSVNDINAQVRRCIDLANELGGKWTANASHRADTQYFAQLGGKVRARRGISVFEKDRDRKYPLIITVQAEPEPKPEPVQVNIETPKPAKVTLPTPTEQAKNMMSFTAWMDSSEENRKKIQDANRHAFIRKMYAELLTDYTVCQIEGWDMFEFPRMLRDALSVCFPKEPKQLSLF